VTAMDLSSNMIACALERAFEFDDIDNMVGVSTIYAHCAVFKVLNLS